MKNVLVVLLLGFLSTFPLFPKEVPSAGEMVTDIILVRPLGFASVVLGSVLYIPTAFFSVLSDNPKEALKESGHRLVVYPFKFTFYRRVGDFPGYMEDVQYMNE